MPDDNAGYLTKSSTPSQPSFSVSTRRGSAAWADSVLPPSPRSALKVESGHLTTSARRPSLGAKTAAGTLQPPTHVMSSDRANSPRGWLGERAAIAGELDFEQQAPQRSERARSAASPDHRRAAKQAAWEYRQRARILMHERERGWNSAPHKAAPVKGIKPVTAEPWSAAAPWEEVGAPESAADGARSYRANVEDTTLPRSSGYGASRPSATMTAAMAAVVAGGEGARHQMDSEQAAEAKQPAVAKQGAPSPFKSQRPAGLELPLDDENAAFNGSSSSRGASSARKKFVSKSQHSGGSGGAFSARDSPGSARGFAPNQAWDASPFRTTPKALRGIKPITREPWAFDRKAVPIYRDEEAAAAAVTAAAADGDSSAMNTARCSDFSDDVTPRSDEAAQAKEERIQQIESMRQRPRSAPRAKSAARKAADASAAGSLSAMVAGARSQRSSRGSTTQRSKSGGKQAAAAAKPPWQSEGKNGLWRSFHMPAFDRWSSGLNR